MYNYKNRIISIMKKSSSTKRDSGLDEVVLSKEFPSDMHSLTIFNNSWITSVPGAESITGNIPLCQDSRIQWLIDNKTLQGMNVLELGPLEGGHTYMLEKIGGAIVTAIEANPQSFLKTLILKNYFKLKAKILYGDFIKYLSEQIYKSFDLCVAVGVLYHMADPLSFLTNISKNFKRIFIWTHYFDTKRMKFNESFDREPYIIVNEGKEIIMHKHNYSRKDNRFLGGIDKYSFWLERESLLSYLKYSGFTNITLVSENTHPTYPDVCLYAEKGL